MDSYVSSEYHLFRPLHNLLPSADMGRMNCEQESRFVNTLLHVTQRFPAAFCLHNPNKTESENNTVKTAKLNLILPEFYYNVERINL
jgi:hypothetical protein